MNEDDLDPTDSARAIAAQLLERLTLNAEGQPFDECDPNKWEAADAAEPEFVSIGPVRLRVVDPDALALAFAAGAVDLNSPPTSCLRVAFAPAEGEAAPQVGQYVVLQTDEPSVSIVFRIWLTYDFAQPGPDWPDLGPDAVRNESFDVLAPGEALLVQVFDDSESQQAEDVRAGG